MASEKYSVKPYEGPIHHTKGQWYNVIGPNGHRLNLRPMPPDEANHLARILNSASSAAADEVGRLREEVKAAKKAIKSEHSFVRQKESEISALRDDRYVLASECAAARELHVTSIGVINDGWPQEAIAAATATLKAARTATDASGALPSALSPIPSAAKEQK